MLVRECVEAACAYTRDVALEQLNAGLAWHFKRYAAEQPLDERREYMRTEEDARHRREGLWQQAEPVPPWRFRKDGAG